MSQLLSTALGLSSWAGVTNLAVGDSGGRLLLAEALNALGGSHGCESVVVGREVEDVAITERSSREKEGRLAFGFAWVEADLRFFVGFSKLCPRDWH